MWKSVVAIIVVSAVTASPAAANELQLNEVARLGTFEGDPWYVLGRLTYAGIASDGSIFVMDAQLETIRRYDTNGTYLATIGRVGDGPGEYRDIRGMIVTHEDELVFLSRPSLLTFVDAMTGRYLRSFSAPTQLYGGQMLEYDNEGAIYVLAVEGRPIPSEEWAFVWRKLNSSGGIAASLPLPKKDAAFDSFVMITPEGARLNFVVRTETAFSPLGYMVTGRSDNYSFELLDPAGTIHVHRDYDEVHLEPGERAQWIARAQRMDEQGGTKHAIPRTKPAFRALYTDSVGRIWVHRYVRAIPDPPLSGSENEDSSDSNWREPNTFDIFEPQGGFVGTVVLPGFARPIAWRGSSVWGVESTDEGEQLVHWEVDGL
jgi:6-bladed beta-propeller